MRVVVVSIMMNCVCARVLPRGGTCFLVDFNKAIFVNPRCFNLVGRMSVVNPFFLRRLFVRARSLIRPGLSDDWGLVDDSRVRNRDSQTMPVLSMISLDQREIGTDKSSRFSSDCGRGMNLMIIP